jgi:hypothetical protein
MRRARSGLCISSDIDMCRSSKPAPNVIPHAQRRKVQPRGRLPFIGGDQGSCYALTMRAGVRRRRPCVTWLGAHLMPAPASGPSPCLTALSTAAPARWPCARAGEPTLGWAGCTPTMPRVLTRSRSAAPAAVVPFLPAPPSRTRRDDPRGPACGRDAAPSRGGSGAALDLAPPGRLGPRAVRVGVRPRDDPGGPAPPQAVVEESQEAAGPGRSGAATSVH